MELGREMKQSLLKSRLTPSQKKNASQGLTDWHYPITGPNDVCPGA